MRFHDGLAWLMQITMFLALGLQVFPSRIIPILGIGLLVSLFLMLIARPLSVFLTLAFSRMSLKEKTLISWVGLRGAVPIILGTFPVLAGVPQAEMIFMARLGVPSSFNARIPSAPGVTGQYQNRPR
jgi:cell volume regulation protein A